MSDDEQNINDPDQGDDQIQPGDGQGDDAGQGDGDGDNALNPDQVDNPDNPDQDNLDKKDEDLDEDGNPKPDPNIKKMEVLGILKQGLSNVSKTADNTGFAFIKLDAAEKELTDVYDLLQNFPHLRYINLSSNQLTSIGSIIHVPHLLTLNLSKNQITSLQPFTLPHTLTFLQFLDVSENQIKELDPINAPKLRKLNLNSNVIETCANFQGHPNLELLEIRKNKLKKLEGIRDMPALKEFYADENEIEDFSDLDNLPQLKILDLRANKITKLTSPMPKLDRLYDLNLGENQIEQINDLLLIKEIESVMSLNVAGNTFGDAVGDIKKETIMLLPYLLKINDEEVTQQEVNDAIEEKLQREEEKRQADEEKRREEEELARQAQAELDGNPDDNPDGNPDGGDQDGGQDANADGGDDDDGGD